MSKKADSPKINLRPMTLADLDQVEAIEVASFLTPWPKDIFTYELKPDRHSITWVAEWVNPDGGAKVVASIVIWLVNAEAHIGTLAVKPGYRRHGIAQKLLGHALIECARRGARQATLEVRVSNQAAQKLYDKFGFEVLGIRKDYYKDTHEDAVLMMLAPLDEEKLTALAENG